MAADDFFCFDDTEYMLCMTCMSPDDLNLIYIYERFILQLRQKDAVHIQ